MRQKLNKTKTINCKMFKQLAVVCSIFFTGSAYSTTPELKQEIQFESLNPLNPIGSGRAPSSYTPHDTIEVAPEPLKHWTANIIVEDKRGFVADTRQNLDAWDQTDEFATNWNLKRTGLYETPDQKQRTAYLNRRLLKYIDKRLAGKVKDSEEGSTLHRVGQVQSALRPDGEARVAEKVKLKFKGKVIQGEGMVKVDNPWVKYETHFNRRGDLSMKAERDISSLGVVTHVDYQISEGTWMAYVDKPLAQGLTARLSSAQADNTMLFNEESDRTLQLMYSARF